MKGALKARAIRFQPSASFGERNPRIRPVREDPLAATVVRNEEDARAAVRDQIAHGADWIKLYPSGAYSFSPTGKDLYEVTYPLPVLQAAIDEAHKLGHKTGCHNYGGEGLHNAIVAGCDTIGTVLDWIRTKPT